MKSCVMGLLILKFYQKILIRGGIYHLQLTGLLV